MKKIKKVLLLYKKSIYTNYFLNTKSSLRHKQDSLPPENIQRLRLIHAQHHLALHRIEKCLKATGLKYQKTPRGGNMDYRNFDVIITLGGDGTFLEAARNIDQQLIIGVNSSPESSVGRFCAADVQIFPLVIERVIENRFKVKLLQRLRLTGIPNIRGVHVVNDILIAHRNPAAMSRYYLTIGRITEEQRSSGVWISTAPGSTGAILSAGGRILKETSKNFQYLCRELYIGNQKVYRFKKGILQPPQKIRITSLMREGMIFTDGSRASWPFAFGQTITIEHSTKPLRVVEL